MALNTILYVPTGTTGQAAVLYGLMYNVESAGQVFNVTSGEFEAYNALNLDDYAVAAVEVGTTGLYHFTVPAALQADGVSLVCMIHEQLGGAKASTDPIRYSGSITLRTTGGESSVVVVGD